jgi:hypothetical protein
MTKQEAFTLRDILASCPQTPKIALAVAIVEKQCAYFAAMKGQIKDMWAEDDRKWFS